MAKRLEAFPASGTARYDWNAWLDGSAWQLVKGEDYTAKSATFLSMARLQAQRRGGKLRTRMLPDRDPEAVVLQFLAA